MSKNYTESFFFGEFDHTLDSQGRVSLPSEWRDRDGETRLILFPGREQDLLLFPLAMFEEFLLKARQTVLANRDAQIALARIGRLLREVAPDKQGRIKLERPMLERIGVKSQLKLIGAITHIKLCAPEQWQSADFGNDDTFLDELQKLNTGADANDPLTMLRNLVKTP